MKLSLLAVFLIGCGGNVFEVGQQGLDVDGGGEENVVEAAVDSMNEAGTDALGEGGDERRGHEDSGFVADGNEGGSTNCAGATAPGQFYVRDVLSDGGVASCETAATPPVAQTTYVCGVLLSSWACPDSGAALACRDYTSAPPASVIEIDCPSP